MQIVIFLVLLMVISPISALSDIHIEIKDAFTVGETINFNFTIISDDDRIINYFSGIACKNVPSPLIELKTIEMIPGIFFKGDYTSIEVNELMEPQTCTAYVEITNPEYQRFEKNFSIITKPSFSFNIKLDKKVFLKNEEIQIDYDSEVENPLITTTLTYPDKLEKQITLPSSIKTEQIGTYELEVSASKEGYKTITDKEQFGVIEKEAEIKSVSLVDEKSFDDGNGGSFFWIWLIVGLAFLVLIIYFVIRKKINSKSL